MGTWISWARSPPLDGQARVAISVMPATGGSENANVRSRQCALGRKLSLRYLERTRDPSEQENLAPYPVCNPICRNLPTSYC